MSLNFNNPKLARFLLQIGLAFIFLYAAYAGTTRPNDWVGYLPKFHPFISSFDLLKVFGFLELILGIWLLSSFKLIYAALVSTIMLLVITVTNLGIFDVTFRDVGLVFASTSLIFLSKTRP